MPDEFCAVCASELQFTAFGPCGHKETCSKCVVRLRFVMNDKRCVICQLDSPTVLVTRFNGEYTRRVSAEEFGRLKDLLREGELQYLRAADAYFDDDRHFHEFRKLCSYTHPLLANEGTDGRPLLFRSLRELRSHLETKHDLLFCSCCLAGRKVFISEQVLYNKVQLQQHMLQGDVEGPMAEAGFKGHPMCKFCRRRYYGDQELYVHMQQDHEQCFLCKRDRPDKYVYYRDYKELEDHFRHEHWLCRDHECLAKHFVVFATETELRQHTAREHGDNMSKWERQQAMRVDFDIQYRRNHPAPDTAEFDARRFQQSGAVVIGGGAGMQRTSRNNSRAALNQAMQASLATAAVERANHQNAAAPRVVPLGESDFPDTLGASTSHAGGSTAYRAAASGQGGGTLNPTEFPALPGTSKAAKKRAKAKAASMAQGAGGGARVVRPSANGRVSPLAADANAFPALGAANPSTAAATNQSPAAAEESACPAPDGAGPSSSAAVGAASGRTTPVSMTRAAARVDNAPSTPPPTPPPTLRQDAFPLLNSTAATPSVAPAGTWVAAGSKKGKQRAAQTNASSKANGAVLPHDDVQFPSLSGQSARPSASGSTEGFCSAASRDASTAGTKVSKALIASNKTLVERVKARLSAEDFAAFRSESQAFSRGALSAASYFQLALTHGLVLELPSLMALLPSDERRTELLQLYSDAFVSCTIDVALPSGIWVPPEAALAGYAQVCSAASWRCQSCGLINSPTDKHCEDCRRPAPAQDQLAPPAVQGRGKKTVTANGSATDATSARPSSATGRTSGGQSAATSSGFGRTEGQSMQQHKQGGGWGGSSSAAALQAVRKAAGENGLRVGSTDHQDFPALAPGESTAAAVEEDVVDADLPPWERVALRETNATGQMDGQSSDAGGAGSKSKKKKQVRVPLDQFLDAERQQQRANPRNVWTQQHPLKTGNEWKKGGGGRLATELRAVNNALSRDA